LARAHREGIDGVIRGEATGVTASDVGKGGGVVSINVSTCRRKADGIGRERISTKKIIIWHHRRWLERIR